MEPKPCSIELKLISCKDLRAFNFFQKLTIYGLVSIASEDPKRELTKEQKQQQRTQTNRDSDNDGSNPEWNHDTRFDLGWLSQRDSVEDLFFRFEFRHDGLILGDKIIGECRVPLTDLIRDTGSFDGVARFVSYEVRSGDGKPNGIFNFSYRLVGIGIGSDSSQILEGRISGYPVLAPEDCVPNKPPIEYPTTGIENSCCYPPVAYPPPPPPPRVSSVEHHYYYPPPPPPPYPYPPPPPPPVVQSYPPFGPGAHPWPPSPCFEHRW